MQIQKNILISMILLCTTSIAYGAPGDEADVPEAAELPVPNMVGIGIKKEAKTANVKKASKQRLAKAPVKTENMSATQGFVAEIDMFPGETRVIKEPNAGRLAVGNGTALSAAVLDDKEILLIANSVGVSSLHIWTVDGKNKRLKVNVKPTEAVPGEIARVGKEIAQFLQTIPNAKATLVGDKVVVEGDSLSDSNLAKIEELSKRYPQILNFTNRLGWEKMVVMDVRVVEFPSKVLKDIGLKWAATGGGAVGAIWGPVRYNNNGPFQINQISGTNNKAPITGPDGKPVLIPNGLNLLSVVDIGFNAQLNMLEQNGSAVVLARPTLSTRSGTKANFLAGGEIPYSVSNQNGTTIVFKSYGIKLEIEPRVDVNGIIRAKILSEVSEVDTAYSVLAAPALSTRRTESEFNVHQGETIVLSGLLKRSKSTVTEQIPYLGSLPGIGGLFRTKRAQDDETELVVFVTPSAVDKHTTEQQEFMDKLDLRMEKDLNYAYKPIADYEFTSKSYVAPVEGKTGYKSAVENRLEPEDAVADYEFIDAGVATPLEVPVNKDGAEAVVITPLESVVNRVEVKEIFNETPKVVPIEVSKESPKPAPKEMPKAAIKERSADYSIIDEIAEALTFGKVGDAKNPAKPPSTNAKP